MMRIFVGVDSRQMVAFHVLAQSIIENASVPVSITPLRIGTLPIRRRGLTEFTYSRFLVPWLCGFEGTALFLDADMLVLGDVGELKPDGKSAVHVVKAGPEFEHAAVMLFDCEKCRKLTPDYVETADDLYSFGWGDVGELPTEWHYAVGYMKRPDDPKLVHFTQGIPYFPETATSDYAYHWKQTLEMVNHSVPWKAIMGRSVHAATLPNGIMVPKFVLEDMKC